MTRFDNLVAGLILKSYGLTRLWQNIISCDGSCQPDEQGRQKYRFLHILMSLEKKSNVTVSLDNLVEIFGCWRQTLPFHRDG